MSEAPARVVVLTGAVIAQNGQEVPLVDIPGKGSKRRVTLVGAAVALGGYLTTAAPTAGAAAGIDVKGELECLALTIYFEARGEPDEGRLFRNEILIHAPESKLMRRRRP